MINELSNHKHEDDNLLKKINLETSLLLEESLHNS
jgi:hypothetical protein